MYLAIRTMTRFTSGGPTYPSNVTGDLIDHKPDDYFANGGRLGKGERQDLGYKWLRVIGMTALHIAGMKTPDNETRRRYAVKVGSLNSAGVTLVDVAADGSDIPEIQLADLWPQTENRRNPAANVTALEVSTLGFEELQNPIDVVNGVDIRRNGNPI